MRKILLNPGMREKSASSTSTCKFFFQIWVSPNSGVCQYLKLTLARLAKCSIPLAKKLKDCGVFGVSSGEYLNYAMKNREEWVSRGKEVVAEMMERFASTTGV